MADVYTRIGYIKGATGATGATGAKGDTGEAATIQVGSVTTVPYGQTANVVNSGTEQAAVFDFTIPQGRPGQQTTEMDNLLLNSITTSAASFPIPAVGETGKVIFGKITKWFSDMAALVASKFDAANVVNNLTTTASGYALDARQGKTLDDRTAIGSWKSINNGNYRVGYGFIDIHINVSSSLTINAYTRLSLATISDDIDIDFSNINGVVLGRASGQMYPVGVTVTKNTKTISLYNTSNANLTFSEIVGDVRLPISAN